MLYSLPQHSEFVKLSSHGLTGRDHGRQLVNEVVHFIPPPLLNLTVRLPVGAVRNQSIPQNFLPTLSILVHNGTIKLLINNTVKVIMV